MQVYGQAVADLYRDTSFPNRMARTHGYGAAELGAIKVLMKRGTAGEGSKLVMNPRIVLTKTTAHKNRFMVLGSKAWLL